MKLAVSSIAWTSEEEADVAAILRDLDVKYVELAPTKIWDEPTKASEGDVQKVIEWWKQYDITPVAFQSMLFTRPDLKLFQDEANRKECLEYLQDFIALAGKMNVTKMVFGSPKNRQRGEMLYEEAFEIAKDFFTKIADTAEQHGVVFCIEPNAPHYACDFVTNASEGAELVRAVNRPGFGLHLDAACMALAGDDLGGSIRAYSDELEHFHISSPMLEQVEQRDDVNHQAAAAALDEVAYGKFVSIEMRPGDAGANVDRVKRAVEFAQKTYFF